jgi:hypothetical protein
LIVALEDEEGVKLLRGVLEAHACLAFAKVKRASVANADADRRHHIRDGLGRNTRELAVNKTDELIQK